MSQWDGSLPECIIKYTKDEYLSPITDLKDEHITQNNH